MSKKKEVAKVLLKDIVIPKGTVFRPAPNKIHLVDGSFYECVIGLSTNTSGSLIYGIDYDYIDELDDHFTDLK